MSGDRGSVIKGPDLFGPHPDRPYVRLSDDTHPFSDEEALYAAVTTTQRSIAVPLTDDDFSTGGLDRDSFVNPWTITSIRHADMGVHAGRLVDETTETIARMAASYLGVR